MYYDRLISQELEATLTEDCKLKWLNDFVKSREDLDFLIGANNTIEWISVYRGTSRIIRILKGKRASSKIKIDGDKSYVSLAKDLKLNIYTNNLDSFTNFKKDLEQLINTISDYEKFDRYYNNKKEGYYQNLLSRKYGINSLPDADFVIIDKEVVIGYDNDQEKKILFGEKQAKYKNLLSFISLRDQDKFGKNLEKKAIGSELDFLAWKSDGTLLLIELKHGTNTSGVYLSPLQIGLYTELFEHYREKKDDFYNKLKSMVEQKQRLGLLNSEWKIPAKIKAITPVLIISEYNPRSTGMDKFCSVLAICRDNYPHHLQNIEVCLYNRQQDTLEEIDF